MCGLTSHYSGCLRGYVWSHFSLQWLFERVCVVSLLTTEGVSVWSHFSLQWLFERVCVLTSHYSGCLRGCWCVVGLGFILSLAGASVQCIATHISLVQYLSQASCVNETMLMAVHHSSLKCQHSSQLPTGDSAILVCRAPGKPWYCRTLVRPGWGLRAT